MKKTLLLQLILAMFLTWSCSEKNDNQVLKVSTPASVQVSADRLNRIDSMLIQSIDDKWIAGAVGFIARDGKIIYNRAFGESDIENRTPMQTDAIFRIASQTKAIASIGLMMLFEEGKFLLDDLSQNIFLNLPILRFSISSMRKTLLLQPFRQIGK